MILVKACALKPDLSLDRLAILLDGLSQSNPERVGNERMTNRDFFKLRKCFDEHR